METATYEGAFQAFLRCTTEKANLAAAVLAVAERIGARSVLDIGAGDGTMAKSIALSVDHYLAIESSAAHAASLRGLGIDVVEEKFPFPVHGTFDLIVASHSLPRKQCEYVQFVEAAAMHLSDAGRLVIITYDEVRGAWKGLMNRAGLEWRPDSWDRNEHLRWFLNGRFHSVEETIVTSYVVDQDFERFLTALGFVYSDGKPDRLRMFLDSESVRREAAQFETEGTYRFPFTHHVFEAVNG